MDQLNGMFSLYFTGIKFLEWSKKMLVSETQAYGKYIQPVNLTNSVKYQMNRANQDINSKAKKNDLSFSDVLADQMASQNIESNRNATNMEITNLYNVLDSNSNAKMDSLAKKYAQLLIDDDMNNSQTHATKDVASFVLNSKTNLNHENMMYMKDLVENHYANLSTKTITDHHRGYIDPHDHSIIYAVLAGIRRKNL